MNRITRQSLIQIFERIDDFVREDPSSTPQKICIFGAAAVLLYGSDQRQTQNIDVWHAASELNDRILVDSARKAGLGVDPTESDPDQIYIQIVRSGVVVLPEYDRSEDRWADKGNSEPLWQGHRLTVVSPPPAIVAAAKMVRAEPRDIEDVVYIMASKALKRTDIARAVELFSRDARDRARKNLVYLEILGSPEPAKIHRTKGDE